MMYVEKLERELQEVEEKLDEILEKRLQNEITSDEERQLSKPLYKRHDEVIMEKRKYAGMTNEEVIIAKLNEILEKLG